MNSLRKNFNEYIQIMDNHDMYYEFIIENKIYVDGDKK